MTSTDSDIVKFALMFFAGLASFFAAPRAAAKYVERHKPKGTEEYFEQQRAYDAYPYLRRPGFYRGISVALMVLAVAMIILVLNP